MPLGINPFCQEVFFIWYKYLYVVIIFLTINYYYYYYYKTCYKITQAQHCSHFVFMSV